MKLIKFLYLFIVFSFSSFLDASATRYDMEFKDPSISEWGIEGHRQFFISPEGQAYGAHKGTSNIYNEAGINYPKVPLFHPYNPTDGAREESLGMLKATLTMHIPPQAVIGLPTVLKEEIEREGIDIKDSLKIFLSAQDFPWKKDTIIHFRPHYATDGPWAPTRGAYWAKRNIKTGLFYSDSQNVHFEEHTPDKPAERAIHKPNEFIKQNIEIHPEGAKKQGDNIQGVTVLSPVHNLQVKGLDPQFGQSLWSYVSYNDGYKNRAIVTLHWTIDDAQQKTLLDILNKKFKKKEENMGKATLNDTPELEGLFNEIGESVTFKNRGGHVDKFRKFILPFFKEQK